jgi:hypothetical protein
MANSEGEPREPDAADDPKNEVSGIGREGPAQTRDTTSQKATGQIEPPNKLRVLIRGHTFLEWLTLVLDVLTLAMLGFYTYYARSQWHAMEGQLDVMAITTMQNAKMVTQAIDQTRAAQQSADAAMKAANIADASLKDSQRSFILQNRPYVTIEVARLLYKPAGGKRLEATCLIRNSGRTPAIGVTVDLAIEGRDTPLPKDLPRSNPKSRLDLGSNQPTVVPLPGKGPIRSDSAAGVETGDIRVYVDGFIDYSDIFGCRYSTEFCGYYDPNVDSENPLMLLGCENHNRRIEYKCKPK